MNDYRDIFILFINDNHFNYLKIEKKDNLDNEIINKNCRKYKNNLIEREKIRKKYPVILKWYSDNYREWIIFINME